MAPRKTSRKGKTSATATGNSSTSAVKQKKPATRRGHPRSAASPQRKGRGRARQSKQAPDGALGQTSARAAVRRPLVGDMDTEQLVTRAGLVVEESRSSVQRSARMLHDCLEAGSEVSSSLHSQGRKLDRIDEKLDEIEENVRQARRNIRRMRTVFGGAINLFRDRKKKKGAKETATKSYKSPPKKKKEKPTKKGKGKKAEASSPEASTLHSAPADPEIDRCLDDMGKSLVQLKDMALGIGSELQRHNEVLDRVLPKAEKAEIGVLRENKHARHLLI